MRERKDSGIEWIGEIPKDWKVHPVYVYFEEGKVKNYRLQEQNLLSLSYGRIIRKDINTNGGLLPASFNTYNVINVGDIIIRPTDLQNDKRSLRTGLVKEQGIITSAYIDLRPKENINSAYYHYLLHSYDITKVFYNMGNGVRQGLNFSEFAKLLLLEPTKAEQQRIVDFLDTQCSEIDATAEDIRKEISLLEDYKKSVITEAVTKGLNPDAEMKDSGIEWIGKIPKDWEVHPVYIYFEEGKTKNYRLQDQNLLSLSYGRMIRKDINTNGGLLPASFNTYNVINAGDIIIRPTDLQNDKRSLRTGLVKEQGIITSAYIDLRPKDNVNSAYYHYLLHCYDIIKVFYNMGNGVRQGLNFSEFAKLLLLEPTTVEQQQIADFLDTKCSEIDTLIADKKRQLDILADYKKSLIYEYVTGKKEVPVQDF